jgi:hypothetical protein
MAGRGTDILGGNFIFKAKTFRLLSSKKRKY